MLPEDEQRLQRERDIALARAPANYALVESDIRTAKAEVFKRAQISRAHYSREQAGYYRGYSGDRNPDGSIPPFRPDPTRDFD